MSSIENLGISRRTFLEAAGLTAGLGLAGCSGTATSGSGSSDAKSGTEGLIEDVDLDYVPSSTPQFALLQGTWQEMGAQLAKEFPEELKCAINLSVGSALASVGNYDTLVERYKPYRDIYDKYFNDDEDGKLSDLPQGIADELDIDYWQAACLLYPASPEGDVPEEEKDCSAAIAWDDGTASGEKGCISVMDADIDVQDLHYMPLIIFKPNNGNLFACMNGLFGSVANQKGFAIQSPGGSSNLAPAYGTFPHLWVAAYSDNVEEAVKFMGDPEKSKKKWVPLVSDFNMMMCDAEGNALDYQVNPKARAIRKNGDVKHLSMHEGDEMPQEAGSYLLTNNLFLSEPLLPYTLSNVERDVLEYWDDVEPRYWTVDKVLADAVKNGGITLDILAQAEGETRYYIPEGWDYDYFPDQLMGRWVPSRIYETLDEQGGLTRADYYGENYDPERWGKPYSKEESRAVEAWAAGWHKPSWSATPKVSTMGYWSPTPVSDVDKNGSRDLFDSNTKTLYYMNGSSARTVSNTIDATGTYAIIRFPEDIKDIDIQATMVDSAISDLKEQLWITARDMDARGVDVDTADGQVMEGYLDEARTALYQGVNKYNHGLAQSDTDDRLVDFAHALSTLQRGICMAQMAQTDPGRIEKDLGEPMTEVHNLESK